MSARVTDKIPAKQTATPTASARIKRIPSSRSVSVHLRLLCVSDKAIMERKRRRRTPTTKGASTPTRKKRCTNKAAQEPRIALVCAPSLVERVHWGVLLSSGTSVPTFVHDDGTQGAAGALGQGGGSPTVSIAIKAKEGDMCFEPVLGERRPACDDSNRLYIYVTLSDRPLATHLATANPLGHPLESVRYTRWPQTNVSRRHAYWATPLSDCALCDSTCGPRASLAAVDPNAGTPLSVYDGAMPALPSAQPLLDSDALALPKGDPLSEHQGLEYGVPLTIDPAWLTSVIGTQGHPCTHPAVAPPVEDGLFMDGYGDTSSDPWAADIPASADVPSQDAIVDIDPAWLETLYAASPSSADEPNPLYGGRDQDHGIPSAPFSGTPSQPPALSVAAMAQEPPPLFTSLLPTTDFNIDRATSCGDVAVDCRERASYESAPCQSNECEPRDRMHAHDKPNHDAHAENGASLSEAPTPQEVMPSVVCSEHGCSGEAPADCAHQLCLVHCKAHQAMVWPSDQCAFPAHVLHPSRGVPQQFKCGRAHRRPSNARSELLRRARRAKAKTARLAAASAAATSVEPCDTAAIISQIEQLDQHPRADALQTAHHLSKTLGMLDVKYHSLFMEAMSRIYRDDPDPIDASKGPSVESAVPVAPDAFSKALKHRARARCTKDKCRAWANQRCDYHMCKTHCARIEPKSGPCSCHDHHP